jgi:hypothetical protein
MSSLRALTKTKMATSAAAISLLGLFREFVGYAA